MITRRRLMASMAASLGAAASLQGKDRPNVVFLSVDDMNDWVNSLGGYAGVKTPNIDALGKRGVLFSNAHCASPLCNPSRTSLLTGMRPDTTGIYNNDQFLRPEHPDIETLPVYFKKNGYHVAGAGKVFHHTAGMNPPDQWDEFKLQVFDDPWYRRDEWYPWNKKIPAPQGHPFNGLKNFQGEFDWGILDRPDSEFGDSAAVQFGQEYLKRKHTKPFFLAVGLWHPHIPMFAPKRFFDMYPENDIRLPVSPEDDLNDVPAMGQKFAAFRRSEHQRILAEGKWKEAVRAYLACVSFADHLIGQLVASLDASPYARNTVLVFWSDNGWHLGEKQHWHKSTLWERSTHVPLIIAAPGMRNAGTARTQAVSLLDLYPTLVELCGLPRNPRLEGESLAALLKNPKAKHSPAVSTFEPGNHSVRTERWRYIRYRDGGEELYDRQTDPNEWKNLASLAEHAGLKRDLAKWIPKTSAPSRPGRDAYDFDFSTYTYKRK
ncbi:MAG: sulfatase [Bryobacteraceae bacterium]|nr:sulfatase [Bryobacteraceae bacterium]